MFCTDVSAPFYFLFSSETSALLYYSHIPTFLVALLLSFFVFLKNRTPASRALLGISILFGVWNFVDLVLWTNTDSRIIMMFWSMLYVLQVLILVCTLYFAYLFLENKEASLRSKMIAATMLLPLIVLMPTAWNLGAFDLVSCEAQQGILVRYFYFLQAFFLLWIFGYLMGKYRNVIGHQEKNKIAIFSLGIFLFLIAFSWGNFFGSLTLKWELEQYGLFGMPVFIAFLAYLIVRYKAFDIKLIGAQGLVVTQFLLIGSMLTFVRSATTYALVGITLIITLGAGFILIRSVKKEVKRKEELQKISERLAIANEELKRLDTAKSEFISIASHQLRTPLTAIKGYASLLLEGSYGKVPVPIQDVLEKIYTINGRLVQLVEDLLNISRIEAGRMQYNFVPTHLEPLVAELVDMFALSAKDKHLELKMHLSKKALPKLMLDPSKMKEVISNLIDNALKYTAKGSVIVTLEEGEDVARIIVSDTGIGIHHEDKGKLFGKFVRTDETMKIFVSGTGLGLYVGRQFVTAHGGRIWAESDGHNKGARFIVELPLVNPHLQKKSLLTSPERQKK